LQTSNANNLLKSRERSEHEAFKPQLPRNHIHSIALSNLLDERKSVTSRSELQRLAERYGVDIWKLENLARFVSSPSVQGGRAVRAATKEGEESITMTVSHGNPIECSLVTQGYSTRRYGLSPISQCQTALEVRLRFYNWISKYILLHKGK
jgi:hypothetical protein